MSNKQTGGYAFPQHTLEPNPNGGEPRIIWQEGMTLRDYFAAQAMQGIQSRVNWDIKTIAVLAYDQADEMMKAREA